MNDLQKNILHLVHEHDLDVYTAYEFLQRLHNELAPDPFYNLFKAEALMHIKETEVDDNKDTLASLRGVIEHYDNLCSMES